jgi:hypothetical protein
MNIIFIILSALLFLLSLAIIVFFIKAIREHHSGNILQSLVALLIAVIGWIFFSSSSSGNSPLREMTSSGIPMLEVTDTIEQGQLGDMKFWHATVLNRGTATATDCAVEVEYRNAEDEQYTFLGYAYYIDYKTKVNITPRTQEEFTILRSAPYSDPYGGKDLLRICIMLKEIRNYADIENEPLEPYYIFLGDHFVRLTAVALNTNNQATPKEFKLHVTIDEQPTLEVIQ